MNLNCLDNLITQYALFDEHTGFDSKLYWRTNSVILKR